MFVWYFKEENTLRFWRLCGRIEKTRRKETAVTLQQLRYVTAVAGTGTISHAVQQRCAGLYMTKQAGNRSYIHALCNQQAGVRMPQAMHIQIQWQVVCFQYQLKAIGKCAGIHRLSISTDTSGASGISRRIPRGKFGGCLFLHRYPWGDIVSAYTAGVGVSAHTALVHTTSSFPAVCHLWLQDRILLPAYKVARLDHHPAPGWGAALFVLHGFYGAAKERIRTARAPRFASRGAETPRWGVSRARLGKSLRAHQKAHCNVLLQCAFCFNVI